jgi:hypothetical protein
LLKRTHRGTSEQTSEDPACTPRVQFESDETVDDTVMSYQDPFAFETAPSALNTLQGDPEQLTGRSLVELSLL